MKHYIQLHVLFVVLTTLALAGETFCQTISWEQTNGPMGGSVNSLFADSTGLILATATIGSGSGIIFRSTDFGARWTRVNLPNQSYNCFAVNSIGQIFTGTSGGIYRSTNGGVSWQLNSNGLGNTSITSLAVNAHDTLFAGSSGSRSGVFRSTDNGNSWSQVGLTTSMINSLAIDPSGNVFAGGYYAGAWKSTDRGDTWSPTGLTSTWVLSLAAPDTDNILAGIALGGGVARSTDGGTNWTQIGLSGAWVNSVSVSPANYFFAASSDSGLYRSTDNGATWARTTLSGATTLSISSDGQIYAGAQSGGSLGGGAYGGVYRSTDNGTTWNKVGVPGTIIPALSIPISGAAMNTVFAGCDSVVFRSTDNGDSWLETGSLPHDGQLVFGVQSLFTTSSGVILVGSYQWGIYRSTDNGNSWTAVGLPMETIYAFLETSGGKIFATTWNSVYVSTDTGASWNATGGSIPGSWLSSLAANSNGDIFVGMANKTDTAYVCRSTDDGQTWMETGMTSHSVLSLLIDAGDTIIVGCPAFTLGGGIFRSVDNGATWTDITTGLINRDVHLIIRNDLGHLFAGTADGVFRSTTNGDLWESVSSGLSFPYIQSLALNSGGTLFAGTFGGGVFRTTQSTTSVSDSRREFPLAFGLNQNYPNPFNPTTNFEFRISNFEFVGIKVYDVLGREIATLVNERLQPGEYTRRWDASGVPSGIYFCRMIAGSFVEVRKMVVVR